MKSPKMTAFAVAVLITAGMSGLTVAPAFADDAIPDAPAVEQVEAPAPEPAPEPAPAPAPEPAPEPAPAPEPPADVAAPETTETSSDDPPADQDAGDAGSEEAVTTEEAVSTDRLVSSTLLISAAAAANTKVTLCHATQGANPWISETIDEQAAYNGHVSPPNNANDHLNDIIPPFSYKVQGQTFFYPGKNLNTLFNGIPGSAILANGCVAPTVVTPAAVAVDQTCSGGTTLVNGHIQLTVLTGVTYTITGPGGNVNFNAATGVSDPVTPGVYSVSFVVAAGYYTSVTSPISVTVGAFTGPCSRILVTPNAVASPETCSAAAGVLVNGSIQLTILAGVTYTITGPGGNVNFDPVTGVSDPVPPGSYSVSFVLDPAYTTAVVSPIVVTVDPFNGVCGNVTQVVPGATPSPETCSRLGILVNGSIQLDVIAGVTYTITGPGGNVNFDPITGLSDPVPPGNYSVTYALGAGLGSSVTNPIPVTVAAYAGVCVPPSPVTPAAVATPQTCVAFVFLTDGNIQLAVTSGVTYTITGPGAVNVPFNLAGITAPIPPGVYSIGYVLDPGYTSVVPNPFTVTITAYPTLCDLTTFPLVVPQVDPVQLTCFGDGSYTLSNDLSDPLAITWTANASPVAEGTHTVTSPTTITITATANAPSYGFNFGQQTSWPLTFQRPANCLLQTLALTGGSPGMSLALAGMLFAAGLGMILMRTRRAAAE